jgi:hypothetical protein
LRLLSMRNLMLHISLLVSMCISASVIAEPSRVFYRYKNDQNVTVMDSTIPPKYISKGYEIVSRSGKVLKIVPPSAQGKDADRLREQKIKQAEQARADLQLRRSYSNESDIEAAKKRNLENLRSNIDILTANLSSAKLKLSANQAQAAAIERSGRPVSDELFNTINNLVEEEKNIKVQIEQREVEYQQVSDKFDEDRKRFIEITKED